MSTFDPKETWRELLTAISTREWKMVKELAITLQRHIRNGGQVPQIFTSDLALPDEFVRGSVLYECEFALQLAEGNMHSAPGE